MHIRECVEVKNKKNMIHSPFPAKCQLKKLLIENKHGYNTNQTGRS